MLKYIMTKNVKVSLVKSDKHYDNIRKAIELIASDLDSIRHKKNILIKPNLTATKNVYANTDVKTVETVIDYLLNKFPELHESKFTILEGSGSAYYEKVTTSEVFRNFGYYELEQKYKNVKLECLEDCEEYEEYEILSVSGVEKIKITKRLLDFDFKISIAIPKVHNYAIATFGIKNMAGLIKQDDKSLIHGLRTPSAPDAKTVFTYIPTSVISWLRRRVPNLVNFVFSKSITYTKAIKIIHYNVVTLAKITWPDLVVLDGYYCMDGNGPVDGFPVQIKAAIASTDPLKADSVGARIMGLQPQSIGYLYYLGQKNGVTIH